MFSRKLVGIGLLLVISSAAHASELTADDILSKVRNRADGADNYAKASLVLKEKNGSARTRNLLFLQKDYGKDDKLTLSLLMLKA